MNYQQSYFDFANKEMIAEQFPFQKRFDNSEEIQKGTSSDEADCKQISSVKSNNFSFLWTIKNFKKFIDRQYEFTSPLFFGNLSSGTSEWKMKIYPENIYPEGVHVALRLLILSEIDRSYSVMYTISFIDDNGKQHKLKTREKVFRRCLDFDECPVISNINIKKKNIFTDESLVIKCEFELLECEILEEIARKPCGNFDSSISRPCETPESSAKCLPNQKINIPSMIQSMNDLSYSEPYKNFSNCEKNVNALIEKDSSLEFHSGDYEIPNCKVKGLEILSDDLKYLYCNSNQHDVVIYTDDGKHTAHEIILTSRCEYFKKSLLRKDKEIHISGLNAETLDAVLYYLYTGKLKQMSENSALDLLKAAKVLGLPYLENMTTETFLSSRIRVNNVTNVFLMAKELKIESLKNSALKYMAENREEVMKTEKWNELMRKDPHSAGEILLTTAYYQDKVVNNA